MERVKNGKKWSLFCPDECPGLSDVYGSEFNALYEKYESEGKGVTVEAREIWFKILDSQIETGTPYMLYKDACNSKSNQKNLGTIKVAIYVRKLLNILILQRQLYVILPVLVYQTLSSKLIKRLKR